MITTTKSIKRRLLVLLWQRAKRISDLQGVTGIDEGVRQHIQAIFCTDLVHGSIHTYNATPTDDGDVIIHNPYQIFSIAMVDEKTKNTEEQKRQ